MLREGLFLGLGKSDLIVIHIEHGVVFSNKHITKDPERSIRGRNVHSSEAWETDGVASFGNLKQKDR